MRKSFRQGQILQLIGSKQIHTQEELARELRELNIHATQVTLSRDIRDLGLVKGAHGYRQIEPESTGRPFAEVANEYLLDIRIAQNLAVLRTLSGSASTVAVALDRERWDEVVGTLAGDDTVLVVTADSDTAARFRRRMLSLIST